MATKNVVTIRSAVTADIPDIIDLIRPFVAEGTVLARTYDELDELLPSFIVAVEDDMLLGCVVLEIYSPKLAEIRSLAVARAAQGKGIGRMLVEACVKRAKERSILEVMAITSADGFFQSCGFDYTLPGAKRALFLITGSGSHAKAIARVELRPLAPEYHLWAWRILQEQWGSTTMVSRGVLYDMTTMPGIIALVDGEPAGMANYAVAGDECEILSLYSQLEGKGIGTALLSNVRAVALAAGCRRLVLITTNDNTHALNFYQKRGWRLAAVRVGAIDAARRIKPEIPLLGNDDIPIHDEIELELVL